MLMPVYCITADVGVFCISAQVGVFCVSIRPVDVFCIDVDTNSFCYVHFMLRHAILGLLGRKRKEKTNQ